MGIAIFESGRAEKSINRLHTLLTVIDKDRVQFREDNRLSEVVWAQVVWAQEMLLFFYMHLNRHHLRDRIRNQTHTGLGSPHPPFR